MLYPCSTNEYNIIIQFINYEPPGVLNFELGTDVLPEVSTTTL